MSFYTLQVSCEKNYYTFAEKPDELFWSKLEEKSSEILGKRLEHLERKETLCVCRSKYLTVSVGPVYKTLREWIRCLYNNVIDRLFVATSQSATDSTIEMLRLDTNQLTVTRDPTLH